MTRRRPSGDLTNPAGDPPGAPPGGRWVAPLVDRQAVPIDEDCHPDKRHANRPAASWSEETVRRRLADWLSDVEGWREAVELALAHAVLGHAPWAEERAGLEQQAGQLARLAAFGIAIEATCDRWREWEAEIARWDRERRLWAERWRESQRADDELGARVRQDAYRRAWGRGQLASDAAAAERRVIGALVAEMEPLHGACAREMAARAAED